MEDLSSANYVFYRAGQSSDRITVTIGANVTKIPDYLFYHYPSSSYAPNITSVVFEEGGICESIGSYAFRDCTSLTSITIGNGVTSIGDWAFDGCTLLTNVYYNGTVDEWSAITFRNGYSDPTVYGATLYYYAEDDGTTTESGNYWYYDEDGGIVVWTVE